ncbi:MAG: type VI secretion system lipoprotein TssJ [bacterium]
MRKYINILVCLFIILLISSCATTQSVTPPPLWQAEKGGIQLRIEADPQLHLYDGSPHTLVVCVYQLTERNVFNQFANEREGLLKLLECNRFDSSVATSPLRLSIHPGEKISESLDRAENAKYVAIVAGYYSLQKENIIRLFEIPVIFEKKGWFFRRSITSRPGPLNLYIYLGPQGIK